MKRKSASSKKQQIPEPLPEVTKLSHDDIGQDEDVLWLDEKLRVDEREQRKQVDVEMLGLEGDSTTDEDEDEDEQDMLDNEDEDSNDEEKEEDVEEEEEEVGNWGKDKRAYYNADTDEEDEEEETQEALRLQRLQKAKMTEKDFIDSEDDEEEQLEEDSDDASESDSESETSNQKVERKKLTKQLNRDNNDDTEEVGKLLKLSPEVLQLTEDLKARMHEAKNVIQPVLEKARRGELRSNKGIALLEIRNQLLMSYCISITFYLYLKTSGQFTKNHPVVEQLVTYRLLLEKQKPLEAKFEYRINKLLSSEKDSKTADPSDPLQYKPNLEDLLPSDNEEEDEADTKYVPPKINAVHYTEPKEAKLKKKESANQRAKNNRILDDLQQEVSNAPEAIKDFGNQLNGVDGDERLRERETFEEENMMRLMTTKKDKKRERQAESYQNELKNMDEFMDLDSLNLKDYKGMPSRTQDSDDSSEEEQVSNKRKKMMKLHGDTINSEDEDYYELMEASHKSKKQSKAEKMASKYAPDFEAMGDDVTGDKRGITREIEKNRGLTNVSGKVKENRNSRVKGKKKYAQGLIKLKSARAVHKQQTGAYGGELTGIKSGVARSVKLK